MDVEKLADGQLEQEDAGWRLRFARRLPHAPEKVWRALTEPEHLSVWFPTDIDRTNHRRGAEIAKVRPSTARCSPVGFDITVDVTVGWTTPSRS